MTNCDQNGQRMLKTVTKPKPAWMTFDMITESSGSQQPHHSTNGIGMQQWRVSVFGEGAYRGNVALVTLSETPMLSDWMQEQARQSGAPASCFAWAKDDGFHVHCFNGQSAIGCCGHGLLATAYVLHNQASGWTNAKLYHGEQSELLQVRWHEEAVWLALPRLNQRSIPVPEWVKSAFSLTPVAAAEAGGDDDYLILEFDVNRRLIDIDVVHQHIVANTRRGVIVTQTGNTDYDFLLRYFAPQYGADEDAVTGSANRVLADYWSSRTGKNQFRALQCPRLGFGTSSGSGSGDGSVKQGVEGGVVLSCLTENFAEISGQVNFMF